MKRTKHIPKVDLILVSDFHLRESIPECWVGDFEKELWDSVDFVSALQKKHNCPVLHAGDLFHHWKPSPYLISKAIQHLPEQFHTIYGQHDLPQHNWEERHRSGIYALEKAGALTVLPGVHWGQIPPSDNTLGVHVSDYVQRLYMVWHILNYQGKKPWPGCTDPMAAKLLRKYDTFDLILTGDNHKPFVETFENRLLVNPGSLTRQTAAQIDFQPRVYLYHAETNSVTRVDIPIQSGAITRDHIERNEERDGRISAFVSKLDGDWSVGTSFEANLTEFFKTNQVRKTVKQIIYNSMDYD